MVAQYLDLTEQMQTEKFVQFEVSNYDYALVQIVGNEDNDTINFYGTLNSGAVQGVTDGNISTSDDYVGITGLDLFSGTYVSSSTSTSNIWKFDVVSRYIVVAMTEVNVNVKVLVMLTKIS